MSFKTFLTEAQFGPFTFIKALAIIERRIERLIGTEIYRYDGKDGVMQLNIGGKNFDSYLYFTNSGKAFRINTFRYKISSIDVWKKYTPINPPDFTMDLGEINSVALLGILDSIAKFIKNPKAETIPLYFLPESKSNEGLHRLAEAKRSTPIDFYNLCKSKYGENSLSSLDWDDINSVAADADVQVPTFIRGQKTGKGKWSVIPPGIDATSGDVVDQAAVMTAEKKGSDPILYIKVTAQDPVSKKFLSSGDNKEAQALYSKIQDMMSEPSNPTDKELKDPTTLFGHLHDLSTLVANKKLNSLLVYGGAGVGKAQPLHSMIKIPGGWKMMGDIKIGDEIIAADGSIAHVDGVFPQGIKDVYQITLADGRKTKASGEHLWAVYNRRKNKTIVTTLDLMERLNSGYRMREFQIPLPKSEIKKDEKLPIDPYVLGSIIGDGCFTGGKVSFTSIDEENLQNVRNGLLKGFDLYQTSDLISYTIRKDVQAKRTEGNFYIRALQSLGLFGLKSIDKFIPNSYKEASLDQKLELIRGLLDTDGYAGKNGNLSFNTVSETLANDFVYVVRSIGGKAFLTSKIVKLPNSDNTCISFNVTVQYSKLTDLVKLSRKKERLKDNNQYGNEFITIKDIKKLEDEECQCISIDDQNHLYITDDFIVTHNTFTIFKAIQEAGLQKGKDYIKLSGKATPVSVYQLLYKWRDGGLIVFDDLDSVWKDKDTANILKAVLDSNDERIVDWQSNRTIDLSRKSDEEKKKFMDDLDKRLASGDDIASDDSDSDSDGDGDKKPIKKGPIKFPAAFEFKGNIIFISNLKREEFDSAVMSRSAKINMDLTPEQIIKRMRSILPTLGHPDVPLEQKEELVDHLWKMFKGKEIEMLTFREYVKCEKILASGVPNWRALMQYA